MADALQMLNVGRDNEFKTMIKLLEDIKNKRNGTYLDGRELTQGLYKYIDETITRNNKQYQMERGGTF